MQSIVADASTQKIYFTRLNSHLILSANLDGTGITTIHDFSATAPRTSGIGFDPNTSKIYWTELFAGRVMRSNVDGSNIEVVASGRTKPVNLDLDLENGHIYWTERSGTPSTDGFVMRADLDGSNLTTIHTITGGAEGIAVSPELGQIYWLEGNGDPGNALIKRSNLDSTNIQTLISNLGAQLATDLAVNADLGKVYFTDRDAGKFRQMNLDGSNAEDLVTGLNLALGVADFNDNGWSVTTAELDRITTSSKIVVGDSNAGNVEFTGEIDLANASTLEIISGGTVNDGGAGNFFTDTNLAITAAQGIGTTSPLGTTVSNLEASGGTGGINIANTGNVTVGGVSGSLTGLSATNSNISLTAASAITVNEAITTTGSGTVSLVATEDITLNPNGDITTAGGAITLNSDSDQATTPGGGIRLNTGAALTSSGGAITLGGGADPLTTATLGTAASSNMGVFLLGATIDSAGGAISVRGTGANAGGANGIFVSSATVTSGAGPLTLAGSSAGAGGQGIKLTGSSTVTSTTGNIDVTGTATGSNSVGVRLLSSGGITSTGSGSITITGTGVVNGIEQNDSGSEIGGTSATGDITLITDSLNLANGTVDSNGALTIKPLTPSATIGLGGGTGTLNLNDTELGNLADGFSSITIGDAAAGTGAVDVDSSTFTDPVTIVGGSIAVTGLNAGANNVRLTGRNGGILDGSGDGSIDVTAAGLTADNVSSGDIDLDTSVDSLVANSSGSVNITNDKAVDLTDLGTGPVGILAPSGSVSVVTTSGAITVSQNVGAGGGEITLDAATDISVLANISQATTTNGITLRADGSITGNASGTIDVNDGGDINLIPDDDGNNAGILNVDGTITLNKNAAGAEPSLVVTVTNGTNSLDGVISDDSAATLVKNGAGTLTLTAANTYSGLTTVAAGALNIQDNAALGSTGASAKTIVQDGARIEIQGNITSVAEDFTLSGNGGGQGAMRFVSSNNFVNGAIDLNAATLIRTEAAAGNSVIGAVDTNGFALTLDNSGLLQVSGGVISDTGSVTKLGSGALNLFGANTYGGATAIQAGTVEIFATNALPAGTTLTLGNGTSGGTLDLNNRDQTLAGLVTSGTGVNRVVSSNTAVPVLTLNIASGTNTFDGIIGNTGEDALALTKAGAGTLTLTAANTATGTATVNAGSLLVNSVWAGAASVNSGGTLGGSGTVSGATTVASGGTLAPGNSPGVLNTGNLNITGNYLVDIAGNGVAGDANGFDQTNVTGTVTLGAASTLTLDTTGLTAGELSANPSFVIINNDGADAVTGTFNGLAEGAVVATDVAGSGRNLLISYVGGDGNDLTGNDGPDRRHRPADHRHGRRDVD